MMRAIGEVQQPRGPAQQGAFARLVALVRGAVTPSAAEARARIHARPGFFAGMDPETLRRLLKAEEPPASGRLRTR